MDDGAPSRPQVWRPGVDGMDEDEELEYDPTVYDCLHAWSLEWPCLSFDVVRDELGEDRARPRGCAARRGRAPARSRH